MCFCSTIWDDNVFWPLNERAGTTVSVATVRRHEHDNTARASTPYSDDADYNSKHPEERETRRYRSRHDLKARNTPGSSDDDWPTCWGRCYAGGCKLQQTFAGCCYIGSDASQTKEYSGYASQQSQHTADVVESVLLTYKHDGDSKRGELLCWGG